MYYFKGELWSKSALKLYDTHMLYFILVKLRREMSQRLFIFVLSTETNEIA